MCIFRHILLPYILRPCILGIILSSIVRIVHPEITWKVTIIVRTRICRIVPVKSSITVLACSPEHCDRSLKVVRWSYCVLKECNRLESLAHTCITHLSVLITPVTVVHVVTHEVIYLLSRSILCTSLARSCKSNKTEFMNITKLLLHTCVVCKTTVVDSLDPVISTDTCRNVECI